MVTGDTLEQLRAELPAKFASGEIALDFPYDGHYEGVYKDRQYASATALYDSLGIAREQKVERNAWFMRNFSFLMRLRWLSSHCRLVLVCAKPVIWVCLRRL